MAAGALEEKPTLFVALRGEGGGSVILAGEWPGD